METYVKTQFANLLANSISEIPWFIYATLDMLHIYGKNFQNYPEW